MMIVRLTNKENVEAIFSHQPKHHPAKYALEKEEVRNNLEKLQVFFNSCHTVGKANSNYTAAIKD
eukprot:8507832-Ditylum_brightwellii.AAC.3